MSSASKALTLLSCFSIARPEIGLTQFCRITGRDKATIYRHLQALESAGLIEQSPVTKVYRLGPALLQLAQIREATVPREEAAEAALRQLADVTGETAHATVLSGTTVYGLSQCESPRHGTRAVIDLDTFPLHATASGLCALSFATPELMDAATATLDVYTARTPTSKAELERRVKHVRTTGFAHAERTYEEEIRGIAVPLFDHTACLAGTVAVACVASRFDAELELRISSELSSAAREITRSWGGTTPPAIESAWSQTLAKLLPLDTAS